MEAKVSDLLQRYIRVNPGEWEVYASMSVLAVTKYGISVDAPASQSSPADAGEAPSRCGFLIRLMQVLACCDPEAAQQRLTCSFMLARQPHYEVWE